MLYVAAYFALSLLATPVALVFCRAAALGEDLANEARLQVNRETAAGNLKARRFIN